MVKHVVEQQQAICGVLIADRDNHHLMPSHATFSVLETIIEVLKLIATLTDALSGEKHVTILALLTITQHIEKAMTVTAEDTGLVGEMKTAFLEDMKKRNTSSDVEELIHTASFLDPRFKESQLDDRKKATVLPSVCEACLFIEQYQQI